MGPDTLALDPQREVAMENNVNRQTSPCFYTDCNEELEEYEDSLDRDVDLTEVEQRMLREDYFRLTEPKKSPEELQAIVNEFRFGTVIPPSVVRKELELFITWLYEEHVLADEYDILSLPEAKHLAGRYVRLRGQST